MWGPWRAKSFPLHVKCGMARYDSTQQLRVGPSSHYHCVSLVIKTLYQTYQLQKIFTAVIVAEIVWSFNKPINCSGYLLSDDIQVWLWNGKDSYYFTMLYQLTSCCAELICQHHYKWSVSRHAVANGRDLFYICTFWRSAEKKLREICHDSRSRKHAYVWRWVLCYL
jgi:hypothetical protein